MSLVQTGEQLGQGLVQLKPYKKGDEILGRSACRTGTF